MFSSMDTSERLFLIICLCGIKVLQTDCTCGKPGIPANGNIRENFSDIVRYSCKSNFLLHPKEFRTRKCNRGQWQGHVPWCVHRVLRSDIIRHEPKHPSHDHLLDRNNASCFNVSNASAKNFPLLISLRLKPKFILVRVVFERDDKQFRSNLTSCATSTGENKIVIKFDNATLTICNETTPVRLWNQATDVTICEVEIYSFNGECDVPDAPVNGDMKVFMDGSRRKAKVLCHPSFFLEGDGTQYCNDSGFWLPLDPHGKPPTCKAIACRDLKTEEERFPLTLKYIPPPSIKVSTHDLPIARTRVQYSCGKGYDLYHRQEIPERLCQANGEWTGEKPVCISQKYLDAYYKQRVRIFYWVIAALVLLLTAFVIGISFHCYRDRLLRQTGSSTLSRSFGRLNETLPTDPSSLSSVFPDAYFASSVPIYHSSTLESSRRTMTLPSQLSCNRESTHNMIGNIHEDKSSKTPKCSTRPGGTPPSLPKSYSYAVDSITDDEHQYTYVDDDNDETFNEFRKSLKSRK